MWYTYDRTSFWFGFFSLLNWISGISYAAVLVFFTFFGEFRIKVVLNLNLIIFFYNFICTVHSSRGYYMEERLHHNERTLLFLSLHN